MDRRTRAKINSANASKQAERFWTAERVEILEARWAAGGVAADFAAELGTTRSAVIAKAARMGLGPLKQNGFRLFEIRSAAAKKSWANHYPALFENLVKANAARLEKSRTESCCT